jgi:hypothetical protein
MPKTDSSRWSALGTNPTFIRRIMTSVSLVVRKEQYKLFMRNLSPGPTDTILDIGVSPDTIMKDSNFFEKVYPYKNNLAVASIEDCRRLKETLGFKKFIKIFPGRKLPLENKSYDIVVSWATLEHVGSSRKQKEFLKELKRVGKKIFLTTPDRMSLYEPHTSTLFLHWLSPKNFRMILKMLGVEFWSKEENLNILSFKEAKRLTHGLNLSAIRFKLLGLPSHIIIYSKK